MMLVFALIAGYFLGAIPFAWLVARGLGVDILSVGSKNAGFTNVWRSLGFAPALVVLVLDIGKGAAACAVGSMLYGYWGMILAGAMAIIGHTLSLFLHFKGGKGVATAAGVFLYISPLAFLLSFLTLALGAGISRYMSVGSLLAAVLAPFYLWIGHAHISTILIVSMLSIYVIWLHRGNIQRLRRGTENRLTFSKKR